MAMTYYVKLIKKNAAGTFGLSASVASGQQDIITNVGYAEVSTEMDLLLNLPILGTNIVTCNMCQWRDGAGVPTERGHWNVRFQIFTIFGPDYEFKPVTPEYDITGVWWDDRCGLKMELDTTAWNFVQLNKLLARNTELYNHFKTTYPGRNS